MTRRFARLRCRTTTVAVTFQGGPRDGIAFTTSGDPDDLPYQIPVGDVGGYQIDDIAVLGSAGRVVYRWLPARPASNRPAVCVDGRTVEAWWAHMCSCPRGLAGIGDEEGTG